MGVGIFGRKDQQHQAAIGNEAFGDFLVVLDYGIGAGRVHDSDLFKDIHWQTDAMQVGINLDCSLFRGIHHLLNYIGARSRVHPANIGLQQRIDKAALTGLNLTDNDKQEWFGNMSSDVVNDTFKFRVVNCRYEPV